MENIPVVKAAWKLRTPLRTVRQRISEHDLPTFIAQCKGNDEKIREMRCISEETFDRLAQLIKPTSEAPTIETPPISAQGSREVDARFSAGAIGPVGETRKRPLLAVQVVIWHVSLSRTLIAVARCSVAVRVVYFLRVLTYCLLLVLWPERWIRWMKPDAAEVFESQRARPMRLRR